MVPAQGDWYWFALGVLAAWRVTHLLHLEYGPFGVIAKARAVAMRLSLGDLMDCFYCLSVWTALPVAWWLGTNWPERVVIWLACSAAAILIEVGIVKRAD